MRRRTARRGSNQNRSLRPRLAAGVDAYLSDARRTLLPTGDEWPMPYTGLYRRTRALVLCSRVQAMVLVVQSAEFLVTGLPLEAVDAVSVVDERLAGWPAAAEALSTEHADALLLMLRGWQRPAGAARPQRPA